MFKFQKNCSAVRLERFGTKVSVYMVQYTFLSFYLYWVHFSIFTISFLKASIPCSWQSGSAGKCHVWRHKIRLNPSLFLGEGGSFFTFLLISTSWTYLYDTFQRFERTDRLKKLQNPQSKSFCTQLAILPSWLSDKLIQDYPIIMCSVYSSLFPTILLLIFAIWIFCFKIMSYYKPMQFLALPHETLANILDIISVLIIIALPIGMDITMSKQRERFCP